MTDKPKIICKGFTIGNSYIPPFKLDKNQLLCIHWPLLPGDIEQKYFFDLLKGNQIEKNLKILGKITRIDNFYRRKKNFSYFFYRRNIKDLIMESTNISEKEIHNILQKLQISPHNSVETISFTGKILLGIEIACFNSSDIILFDTGGLDPLGVIKTYQTILEKLDNCTAIHFSEPVFPNRMCCSQAQCIEVTTL